MARLCALDEVGKPSFSGLQGYRPLQAVLVYYTFDVMVLAGRDLRAKRLDRRKQLLEEKVIPRLSDPIRFSPELPGTLDELIHALHVQGFEGLCGETP